MNKLAAVFVSLLISASSFAVAPAAPAQVSNEEREKITMCNRAAQGKSGEAHKKFIKDCLAKK
jgi:hypothetical protein